MMPKDSGRREMPEQLCKIYSTLFSRPFFAKFNRFLFNLSIRGLGILNNTRVSKSSEILLVKKLISKIENPVVFDVGANVGEYSKSVREVIPTADIYAFEPHPVAFRQLKQNIQGHNINFYNTGCGSKEEESIIYDYDSDDCAVHASVYREVIEKLHERFPVEYKIDLITLDGFIEKNAIERIDLLKIDAEGFEMEILKGANNSIEKGIIEIIQFEFNEMNVVSRNFFKDFYGFLKKYDIYRLLNRGLLPIKSYSPLYNEIYGYQNLVCVRKDSNIEAWRMND